MNHSNFQLFTILQYFEKPKSQKNGMITKLFLLRIRTTTTEMLNREKIMLKLHQLLVVDLTTIVAFVIGMINHMSYGLNLPNIVSITWCMSSLGLEEGRLMSYLVEIGHFLILCSGL